jgi:DNA-binding NarL/FixJ family response regulator
MSITVLLADDQPLIRLGFRMILEDTGDIEVIGEAADGRSATEQALTLRPDVVLLDIRMPGMDGLEATRRIMAADPQARILVLTTFDLDEYAFAALRGGASGFLLKDAPVAELVHAIRVIAQGHALVAPRITRLLLDAYAPQLPDPLAGDRPGPDRAVVGPGGSLTGREHEVLLLLARGRSNAEIATDLVVSEVTVKSHVGAVLHKLDLRNRVAAVIYACEHGLIGGNRPARPAGDPGQPHR